MADKHPYVSGSKPIHDITSHLRQSLPNKIDAQRLQKLSIAPKNEGYVINILRFLDIIDDNGDKTELAEQIFFKHNDEEFQSEFAKCLKTAYSDLFDTHGDASWTLDQDKLIAYFRAADKTSQVVGQRQANTFIVLSAIAGMREMPSRKAPSSAAKPGKGSAKKGSKQSTKATHQAPQAENSANTAETSTPVYKARDVGLTVRVEVNLPAGADQETYDRIFRSIRENLIDE